MSWVPLFVPFGTHVPQTQQQTSVSDLHFLYEDYYEPEEDGIELKDNLLLLCCGSDLIYRTAANKICAVSGLTSTHEGVVLEGDGKSSSLCQRVIVPQEKVSALYFQIFETRLPIVGCMSVFENEDVSHPSTIYLHTRYDLFRLLKADSNEKYIMESVHSGDDVIFDVFVDHKTVCILTQKLLAFGNGRQPIDVESVWRADPLDQATGCSSHGVVILTEHTAVHILVGDSFKTIITVPSDVFSYKEFFLGATIFQEHLIIVTNRQYLVYSFLDPEANIELISTKLHNSESARKCTFLDQSSNANYDFVLISDKMCSYYRYPGPQDSLMLPAVLFITEQLRSSALHDPAYVNLPVDKRLCVADQFNAQLVSAGECPLGLVVLTDNGNVFLLPNQSNILQSNAWSRWINSVPKDLHYSVTSVNADRCYLKMEVKRKRFPLVYNYSGMNEVQRDDILDNTNEEYSMKLIGLWEWD